jgi:hypothetical protein
MFCGQQLNARLRHLQGVLSDCLLNGIFSRAFSHIKPDRLRLMFYLDREPRLAKAGNGSWREKAGYAPWRYAIGLATRHAAALFAGRLSAWLNVSDSV